MSTVGIQIKVHMAFQCAFKCSTFTWTLECICAGQQACWLRVCIGVQTKPLPTWWRGLAGRCSQDDGKGLVH